METDCPAYGREENSGNEDYIWQLVYWHFRGHLRNMDRCLTSLE